MDPPLPPPSRRPVLSRARSVQSSRSSFCRPVRFGSQSSPAHSSKDGQFGSESGAHSGPPRLEIFQAGRARFIPM